MDDKVRAARIKASRLYPYLSTALFSIRMEKSNEVQTMDISKSGLVRWNPDFVARLELTEIAAVLAHEVWHLLRLHAERGPKDPEMHFVWNIACDCEINDSLGGLPKGCVYPSTFGMPDNLTAEEYFEKLKDKTINVSPMVGAGECGSGARGGEDETDGPLNRIDKELLAKHTAEQIRSCGNVPASLRRWAEAVLNPKVPWEKELRASIKNAAARVMGKTDFTFTKRSRRAAVTKAILPGMISYKPKVAVVLDTSGSMSEELLNVCLGELKGILKAAADKVYLVVTDADVHSRKLISRFTEADLTGGGGTDMRVGISEALKVRPDIIIVLSDFCTPWPASKPRCEVIGVSVGGFTKGAPDWMKVIKIEDV